MTHLSNIEQALLKIHSYTGEQLTLFTSKITPRKLNKNELLLKPGQMSNYITFINSGSLRLYTTTVNGDLTINFFTENDWAADLDSLMRQQPSANYIEAVEDTDIATITLRDIHWLMDRHPIFHMLTSMLQGLTISTAHIASISTKSPDERYKELFITHPEWLNRFPLKQIASYLGMTPETLSRVRARLT